MHLMTRNYPLGSDIRERNTWKHGFKSVCALMSLPPPPHPMCPCGKYRSITARGIMLVEIMYFPRGSEYKLKNLLIMY